MDEYMNEERVEGGGLQAILAAPFALPLLFIALLLILIGTNSLYNGNWMSGFTLFLIGGMCGYVGYVIMT